MLNKLFGSNARVKLMKLFVSKPDERFYIRQVARDLKLQLNSVRRELENLEQFGLLVSNPAPQTADAQPLSREEFIKPAAAKAAKELPAKLERKYYQANRTFILYDEIRSLLVKAQILYEKDFVKKLERTGSPKLVALTGFFVNKPDAPVDLFIVGRVNKIRLQRLIRELETDLNREINYTVMDLREFKYRRDMTDVFLYQILEAEKIMVINELL